MNLRDGALAFVLAATAAPLSGTAAGPALFETPAWQKPGELSLRFSAEGGLLLRHHPSGAVYLYQGGEDRLSLVSGALWDGVGSAVAACGSQSPPPFQALKIDRRSDALLAAGRPVPVAGGRALALLLSPGGGRVAVLSTGGKRRDSPIPFASGRIEGPFYHQAFSFPALVPAGPPQELPLSAGGTSISLCWSSDGRYVVYHDVLFFELAIVPVAKEGVSHDH